MSYLIDGITASTPPGAVTAFFGTTDPAGWVICDGQSRSNADGRYNNLINLQIGQTGANQTYIPPNLRAMFLRGIGTNGSYTGPAGVQQQQADGIISHTHNFTYNDVRRGGDTSDTVINVQDVGGERGVTTQAQANGLTETRPVNIGVNWILKL